MSTVKTAGTKIDPSMAIMAELAKAMGTLNDNMSAMREEINALKSAKPQTVPSAPSVAVVAENTTVKLSANPSDKELRDFASANNISVGSRGTIASTHPVRKVYAAAYAEANGKVEVRAQVATGRWSEFMTAPKASSEAKFNRPSAKDAADMLMRHPEREAAEAMENTSTNPNILTWSIVKSMTGRNGRANPANLSGNDRRVAFKLMTGERTASLLLVGCEIMAKLRAAGLV